jgi:hypothetical protein
MFSCSVDAFTIPLFPQSLRLQPHTCSKPLTTLSPRRRSTLYVAMSNPDAQSGAARLQRELSTAPARRTPKPDPRQFRRGLAVEEPLSREPPRMPSASAAAAAAALHAADARAAVSRAASGLAAGRFDGDDDGDGAHLLPRMKRPEELRELLRICRSVFRDDPGQRAAAVHEEEVRPPRRGAHQKYKKSINTIINKLISIVPPRAQSAKE